MIDNNDLDGLWAEVHEAIDLGEFGRGHDLIDAIARQVGEHDAEVLYERAILDWEQRGPEQAIPLLDELLCHWPEHADGHYARGFACEEIGDREGMIQHFSEVLRLDARVAEALESSGDGNLDFIESTALQVLIGVPREFREHLRNVPVVLEAQPHPDIVREGFDPRALGLFEGFEQSRMEAGGPQLAPTRIVLFHANLLADFPNREQLASEIEITLLHEIGHFFGLDEDDVERLGLE